MSNDLVVIEQALEQMTPALTASMPQAIGLPVERLIRTVVVSCERLPKLLQCNRQSLFNAAVSAAVLGLEVDGVTGQAYLIPYKGQVQLQIGFKGHETIAARAGFIFEAGVIREGDDFDIELGTKGHITVRPQLGGRLDRRILAAYAIAKSHRFPDVPEIMDIDEMEKVRGLSMAGGADKPWAKWFDQMCIKTVKKRLAKSLPLLPLHMAGAIDDAPLTGAAAYIEPSGEGSGSVQYDIDSTAEVYPERTEADKADPTERPPMVIHMKSRKVECFTIEDYAGKMKQAITAISDMTKVEEFFELNKDAMKDLFADYTSEVNSIYTAFDMRRRG